MLREKYAWCKCWKKEKENKDSSKKKLEEIVALCKKGDEFRVLKKIDRYRIDLNQRTALGETPLTGSVFGGHIFLVEALIDANADVNFTDSDGSSPLHFACQEGWINIVTLLLERQADPNVQRLDGCTPLMLVVENGFLEIVQVLLRFDPDLPAQTFSSKKLSSRQRAFPNAHMCKLQAGVVKSRISTRFRRLSSGGLSARNSLDGVVVPRIEKVNIEHRRRIGGGTALHDAVQGGYYTIVEYLAETCNANVHAVNNHGLQPIHLCCRNGLLQELNLLLSLGADVNKRDAAGFTPLCHAIELGHVEIVLKLLHDDSLETLCTPGWNGNTALHLASAYGHTHIVEILLVKDGARSMLNVRNWYGFTPIHLAVQSSNPYTVDALIQAGCDLTLQSTIIGTPLHLAIDLQFKDMAEKLITAEPSLLSQQNGLGVSCRELASVKGMQLDKARTMTLAPQLSFGKEQQPQSKLGRLIQTLQSTSGNSDVTGNLSLGLVLLIEVEKVLQYKSIPSYTTCQANHWHVSAEEVVKNGQPRVLFVSHGWESESQPDPLGFHFALLEEFLRKVQCQWVWIDYSCVFPHPGTHWWKEHMNHILLALWCCTNFLILPQVVDIRERRTYQASDTESPRTLSESRTSRSNSSSHGALNVYSSVQIHRLVRGEKNDEEKHFKSEHLWVTSLQDYLERAWCLSELIIIMLQEDVPIHCCYKCGPLVEFVSFGRLEGCGSFLGFAQATVACWTKLLKALKKAKADLSALEQQRLLELWGVIEPVDLLSLIQKILREKDANQDNFRKASRFFFSVKVTEAEKNETQEDSVSPKKNIFSLFRRCKDNEDTAGVSESLQRIMDLGEKEVDSFSGDFLQLWHKLGECSNHEDKIFAFRQLIAAAHYAENLRSTTSPAAEPSSPLKQELMRSMHSSRRAHGDSHAIHNEGRVEETHQNSTIFLQFLRVLEDEGNLVHFQDKGNLMLEDKCGLTLLEDNDNHQTMKRKLSAGIEMLENKYGLMLLDGDDNHQIMKGRLSAGIDNIKPSHSSSVSHDPEPASDVSSTQGNESDYSKINGIQGQLSLQAEKSSNALDTSILMATKEDSRYLIPWKAPSDDEAKK